MALVVGKQAQIMATWHSIVDQWLRGSISSAELLISYRGWTPKKVDLQVWLSVESLWKKTTTRMMPMAVNLHQPFVSYIAEYEAEMEVGD